MSALPVSTNDRIVWDNWLAKYRLPAMSVHDEVGTFALLCDGALTTEDIAVRLGLDPRALGIHLSLLAAMDLVEKRLGKWSATAETRRWFHPDSPGYAGGMVQANPDARMAHDQLLDSLKTGDVAKGHASAAAEWERGELPQDMADRVTAYMNCHSQASSRAVAQQPLFGEITNLGDVGGGSGVFAIEIAKAWPQLSATILEIETVCNAADRYIADADLAPRVTTRALNMFTQDWPDEFDALFFSNVFHDWSEETNRLLARKAFAALPSGGRILLHEILMDDDMCGPYVAAAFSLLMLLGTRGKQYSLGELAEILESAGFADVTATQTGGGYYSLVTARKP